MNSYSGLGILLEMPESFGDAKEGHVPPVRAHRHTLAIHENMD